jgi:hypothetical protein
MADDAVDTMAAYDLDDDFPDYANEQNKELNQIVTNSSHSLNPLNSTVLIIGERENKVGLLIGS